MYLLLIAATLGTTTFAADNSNTLVVSWNEYKPHQWQGDDGSPKGLDIEIIEAVANKAGFELIYKKIPWNRVINISLKNGEADVTPYAAITKERQAYAYFSSIAYAPADSSLFIHKDKAHKFKNVLTIEDLLSTEVTLGSTRGYVFSAEYEDLLKKPEFKNKILFSAKEEQNVRMLLAGRVDGIFAGHLKLISLVNEWNAPEVIKHHIYINKDGDDSGPYFMFSKASVSKEKLQRFNQALEQLESDGTLKRLLNKYLTRENNPSNEKSLIDLSSPYSSH